MFPVVPSVAAAFPGWEPYPDVWIVVGLMVALYAIAVVRLGPRLAIDRAEPVSRVQVVSFGLGAFALLLAATWPIDTLADDYLFSVHMVEYLVFTLVAPPLILMGIPAWLMRSALEESRLLPIARWVCRFLPALVIFNVVLVVYHIPDVMDLMLRNDLAHFAGHASAFVVGLVMWMPVLSPLPEIPRLSPVGRMGYLFLQSIVPTVPASFLTFGDQALYRYYEGVPQLFGLSAVEDQRIAGLVMKIGAGFLLWALIATLFFRWYSEEEAASAHERRLARLADGTAVAASPPARSDSPARAQ